MSVFIILMFLSRYDGQQRIQPFSSTVTLLQKKSESDQLYQDEEDAQPIKLSSSEAYHYSSFETFTKRKNTRPLYEAPVIGASFFVLFVYFAYLREENSIDKKLDKGLFETFPDMEVTQLKVAIQHAEQKGSDTSLFLKRLKELTDQ